MERSPRQRARAHSFAMSPPSGAVRSRTSRLTRLLRPLEFFPHCCVRKSKDLSMTDNYKDLAHLNAIAAREKRVRDILVEEILRRNQTIGTRAGLEELSLCFLLETLTPLDSIVTLTVSRQMAFVAINGEIRS